MIKSINEIERLVALERREAKQDGLAEGYRVAERIATWYAANEQLKEPHSPEVLRKWTLDALSELRTKIGGAT